MNDLTIFDFKGNDVRILKKDNEIYWVAKDVCEVLEIQNTTQALRGLDKEELTIFNIGGQQGDINIINESGLYSLVLSSRKPQAKEFKKWVTSEVLPSIRKTGGYSIQNNYVTKDELKDFGVSIVKEMFKQMIPLIENKRKEYIQDYFSVIGYANNKNISISFSEAVRFGKDASKLSIEMKKEKRIIPDERFGKVGSYHVSVLEKIFEV